MKGMQDYDVFQFISQREDGTMLEENAKLVSVADYIKRTARDCRTHEKKSASCIKDVVTDNATEKRLAESWAKDNNCWIPLSDIFSLGVPGPSGSEADTYISSDMYVYKMNNLMHCHDSILLAIEKFLLYNIVFPDSSYKLHGFAGFGNGSVYPVVKQSYIKDGVPASQNEIDCYMSAIGFEKIDIGKFKNKNILIWDVLPKNVLKDSTGDIFVIDAEIQLVDV